MVEDHLSWFIMVSLMIHGQVIKHQSLEGWFIMIELALNNYLNIFNLLAVVTI